MKVAIAAGGTGGHVFPAVAIASALAERGSEMLWFGRPNSIEEREAASLGTRFVAMPLQGLKRKWSWNNVLALTKFLQGRRIARDVLKTFAPDLLFALGSYVSAPAVSAALSIRLPVVLHEQNVVPGLVVRAYAKRAALLLLSKPLIGKGLKAKTRVVGMPLRSGIVLEREDRHYLDLGLDPTRKTLFVCGGSQGARALCSVAVDLAQRWESTHGDWQIFLQTGVANREWTAERKKTNNLVAIDHVQEMGKAYACADAIVSRSGAVSCAELEAVGKPAILVPYPHSTRDHQVWNAKDFVHSNPGTIILEKDLDVARLEQDIETLIQETQSNVSSPTPVPSPVEQTLHAFDEISGGTA